MSQKIKAGGRREGAGRKPSIPHRVAVVDGVDMNQRKTFTCYGAMDEVGRTRHYLQVWRMLRFNTNEVAEKLDKLKGGTVYKLLTAGKLTPAEEKRLAKILPDVLALHHEYRKQFD